MTQAIQLFGQIWQKIMTNIFTTFDIGGGVKVGWIVITVGIMAALIRTIMPQVQGMIRSDIDRRQKDD